MYSGSFINDITGSNSTLWEKHLGMKILTFKT